MGTLSEELAATMLREFSLVQAVAESQWLDDLAARMTKPPTWSWTPGTFVFPEGLCCYCGGVMRSDAIWRTDNLQFLGSWKVCDGPEGGYFDFEDSHPHVIAGAICMGGEGYRATSVADALFLAFNPLSSYFGNERDDEGRTTVSTNTKIRMWFADRFNHTCGEDSIRTIDGVDLRHVVAPEAGCHCQHCRMHRGEVQCRLEGCGEWYELNVGHGRFKCEVCSGYRGRRFCIKHKHDRQRCADCNDTYDLYDVDTGGPAAEPAIRQCEECKAKVCLYCLGEAEDSEPVHGCVEGAVDRQEACDHYNCEVCCECGRDQSFI